MCGHAERQAVKRPEGGKIGRLQGCPAGLDHRQLEMAVGGRPAMARQVLEHRQHAAGHEALGDGAGDGRDLGRFMTVGAVSDHRIGAGDRNIGQRCAIDIDAEDR